MKNQTRRAFRTALPILLASSLCGCGLLRTAAEAPGRLTAAALGQGDGDQGIDPNRVQARLMRFADLFAVEIGEATRQFAEGADTAEARIQGLTWKLEYTNAVWRLAAGSRPFAALFDTVVVITALRVVHEERWLEQWGEADRPMIESLTRLEKGVWDLAGEGLTEGQVGEVRAIVADWAAGDPENRVVDISRLPGFVDLAQHKMTEGEEETGFVSELTDLMSIDPLSGLEPAVREVEQTRQLAERAFYFLQRMPELLSARVELLTLRSAKTGEVEQALAGWERMSGAAASLAATAETLPAELTRQREGLVRDLETAHAPLTELLAGARTTAEAGRAMSDALTETVRAFDALMERFSADAAVPGAAPETEAEPARRPFDVTEYGAAAERIGIAARELGVTIATLDQSLPEVRRVIEEAAARGERSVDHAFLRALQLIGAAIVGAAVAVLLVRRMSWRWRESDGGAAA